MLSMIVREKGAKKVQRTADLSLVNSPFHAGSSSWPGVRRTCRVCVIANRKRSSFELYILCCSALLATLPMLPRHTRTILCTQEDCFS